MTQNENLSYQENLCLKAEALLKKKFGPAWDHLDEGEQKEEIEQALPLAELCLQWAAETARALIGPQFSKTTVDAMLEVLGVIPPIN